MDYVVTYWTKPDQTGENVHIFTWADTPELAAKFAQRQIDLFGPSFKLYPGEPRALPDVAAAVAVAERAWTYGAPALYEEDVADLFAALGQPERDDGPPAEAA